ncbi:MAG: hypothetical protein V4819_19590 [Verrucomicrobiota bacterium]
MNQPTEKKRFPAWLRHLGWLGFSVLGVATVLVALRWYLIGTAHRTAVELVKQGRALPPGFSRTAGEDAASSQPVASRDKPLAEFPLLQAFLDEESPAGKELQQQLSEMTALFSGGMINKSRVDGVVSFRTLLGKMGMEVPESMTEAEAAAEFLKRADKFSGLLARWRDAVAEGPWDYTSPDYSFGSTPSGKIAMLSGRFPGLLGVRAEAYLRTGDADAAFSDWQTLALSAERCNDKASLIAGMVGFSIKNQLFRTAHAGMQLGGWTDEQLGQMSETVANENALASMFRDVEQEKSDVTGYFSRFPEKRAELARPFLGTQSPVDNFVNQIALGMTTEQQMADNIALMQYKMEQPFTLFDPNTGFYQAPPGGEVVKSKSPDTWFDKFYFMYSDNMGDGFFTQLPERIIKNQSAVDQTRIAAALELHQRSTGQYPETLEAVSGAFPGALPRDIATGQPYFYQLNADGGYTLWGTGIDGKSEGGNEKTDVTWTHRPVKGK